MQNSRSSRVGTIVLTTALALGGVLATSVPAQAAGSYRLTVAKTYSQASTQTNGGTQGQSHARHGCRTATSAWNSVSSSAYAACGNQYGQASARFR
jgi:hypothetical protein